jgi:hypothetical protein
MQLLYRDSTQIDDLRTFDVGALDRPKQPQGEYLRLPVLWMPDARGLLYVVEKGGSSELRKFDLATHTEQIIAPLNHDAVVVGLEQ